MEATDTDHEAVAVARITAYHGAVADGLLPSEADWSRALTYRIHVGADAYAKRPELWRATRSRSR